MGALLNPHAEACCRAADCSGCFVIKKPRMSLVTGEVCMKGEDYELLCITVQLYR